MIPCPTYVNNKTYDGFAKNDPRGIALTPEADAVDEINYVLICCVDVFSNTNKLIILDDCAVSKDLKKMSNKFINLAFSGRHRGLSVSVLTQQLTSILKPFRDNVACVISFHNTSQSGMKTLFDDYGGGLCQEESHQYAKLCFCLRFPNRYYIDIPSS